MSHLFKRSAPTRHGPHSSQLGDNFYAVSSSLILVWPHWVRNPESLPTKVVNSVVLCIVRVYMCTVLLPPGGYPIAANKYIKYIKCLTFMHRNINLIEWTKKWLSHRSGNRQPQTYVKPAAAITVFELLMMGGVSSETCWAIKKHWNNKFFYTVASVWFFLWDLYQIYQYLTIRRNGMYVRAHC